MRANRRPSKTILRAIVVGVLLLSWGGTAQAEFRVDAELRKAAERGDIAAIDGLLAQGADPNRADALLAAILSGRRPSVDILLARGADPNAWARGRDRLPAGAEGSPVFAAAKRGDRELLQALKRHGANLDAGSAEFGMEGETPLLCAVAHREWSAARLLIEMGADVKRGDRNGTTALIEGAALGGPEAVDLVKTLLAHGADPNARNHKGASARDVAHEFGGPDMLALLNEKAPAGAYDYPDDRLRIAAVLSYKAACDQSTPGYALRLSATYARWATPRAATIGKIEAEPEFQRNKAEMVRQASLLTSTSGNEPEDAERRQQAANFHALCETHLPNELAGVVTEYKHPPEPRAVTAGAKPATTQPFQSAAAKVGSVTIVHKSASSASGGLSAAPPSAPSPTPP